MVTATAPTRTTRWGIQQAVAAAFQRPHFGAREIIKTTPSRTLAAAKSSKNLTQPAPDLLPSLAGVLRKETIGNWLMPYMSYMTPQFIETTIRGGVAGNLNAMWQLFDLMIDTDSEIQSCINELVEGVMCKTMLVEAWHEEDEEETPKAAEKRALVVAAMAGMRPDPFSNENDFAGTVKDLLFARYHGQVVLEMDWYDTYGSGKLWQRDVPGVGTATLPRSTYWVHPNCYGWTPSGRLALYTPKGGMTAKDLTNLARKMKETGLGYGAVATVPDYTNPPNAFTEFPPDKFIVGIDKAKTGSALAASSLRCLAWWWLAKNFCGDYLLKNAEMFGVPFRKASYAPGVSDAQKREVAQMLQSVGSQGWALVPEGVLMEFERAMATGAQSPHAFLYNLANSNIRKVILGQTMTGGANDSMGKGGGKAFGDVELEKTTDRITAATHYIEAVFNSQVIPAILRQNYNEDSECPKLHLVDDEDAGLPAAQTLQVLSTLMDVPDSFLHRKFKIPKVRTGEGVAGVDSGTLGAQAKAEQAQQQQEMDAQQEQAQMMADAQAQQAQDPQQAQAARSRVQAEFREISAIRDLNERGVRLKAWLHKNSPRTPLQAAGSSASKFGCLMAMVPAADAEQFASIEAKIEPGTLADEGVEDEKHVTIFYGFNQDFDPARMAPLLSMLGPIKFTLGKLTRFECQDYDVLKFDVESPQLEKLNAALGAAFAPDVTPSEHDYHPHLTICYCKKGSNVAADGSSLAGKSFTVKSLLYSLPQKQGRVTLNLVKK